MIHRIRLATLVTLFAVAAACGGGSSAPATPTQVLPSASQAAPTAPSEVAATPIVPSRAPSLTSLDNVEFPADTEMLVLQGSDHGHGGWFHLKRYVRRGSGPVETTDILTPPEGTNLTGVARTALGRLIASECVGMECYYEGGGPKPVSTNFMSSADDGVTWSVIGAQHGEWWVEAADGEQALAVQTDNADNVLHFITVPAMAIVAPPPGTGDFSFTSGDPLLWSESAEATLVDSANNVVAHFDLGSGNHAVGAYAAFGIQVAALIREQRGADPAVTLLGRFAAGASITNQLWLAPPGLSLGPWLNDHTIAVTTWYGTLDETACGTGPALLDVTTGAIGIIRAPFATPDCIHVPRVQSLLWAGPIE